jgi:molybdate transport system substrate-binding protein
VIRAEWLFAAALATSTVQAAAAEEITALFPFSMEHTALSVVPPFEKSSGNKVTIQYGTAGAVATKVRNGEVADVLISTAAQVEGLSKENKLVAGSSSGLAKVGVGMLVRKGATKPDISSVDKFKAVLLASKGISYTDPALGGPAGIYVAKMLDQLGIGPEMRQKTKLSGPGAAVSTTVLNGEAEFGFIMINEILADTRVDYVGPLPQSIQDYTKFAIGLVASGKEQAAGSALVKLMTSPDTLAVMRRLGFEPF